MSLDLDGDNNLIQVPLITKARCAATYFISIGLSTLRHWLSRNRDPGMNVPGHRKSQEDMAAELKRLRREMRFCAKSEIFGTRRQLFSSGRQVGEVSLYRSGVR